MKEKSTQIFIMMEYHRKILIALFVLLIAWLRVQLTINWTSGN